jgi:hypothetical protein
VALFISFVRMLDINNGRAEKDIREKELLFFEVNIKIPGFLSTGS